MVFSEEDNKGRKVIKFPWLQPLLPGHGEGSAGLLKPRLEGKTLHSCKPTCSPAAAPAAKEHSFAQESRSSVPGTPPTCVGREEEEARHGSCPSPGRSLQRKPDPF